MRIVDMPHGQKFTHPSSPGTVWQKLHASVGVIDGINYVVLVVEQSYREFLEVPFVASTDITERHSKTEFTPINWK